MSFKNITLETRGKIVLLTMARPKMMNALNSETLDELSKALTEIEKADDIRGAIITGEGKAFVAGADISQLINNNSEQARAYVEYAQDVFNRIESMSKPFIAAVNGYALGGGCELALACDLRLASEQAQFGLPEVNLGLIPSFGGTQRLPRLIGGGRAKEMIFTGRIIRADEALAVGLVNKVVTPEALLPETLEMMELIVSKSAMAIRNAKTAVNRGADVNIQAGLELEKDLIALCFAGPDQKEGCQAFLEKRKPNFIS